MNFQNELYHHGIKGQKHGVRRFQYANNRLTPAGKERYGQGTSLDTSNGRQQSEKVLKKLNRSGTVDAYSANSYGSNKDRVISKGSSLQRATDTENESRDLRYMTYSNDGTGDDKSFSAFVGRTAVKNDPKYNELLDEEFKLRTKLEDLEKSVGLNEDSKRELSDIRKSSVKDLDKLELDSAMGNISDQDYNAEYERIMDEVERKSAEVYTKYAPDYKDLYKEYRDAIKEERDYYDNYEFNIDMYTAVKDIVIPSDSNFMAIISDNSKVKVSFLTKEYKLNSNVLQNYLEENVSKSKLKEASKTEEGLTQLLKTSIGKAIVNEDVRKEVGELISAYGYDAIPDFNGYDVAKDPIIVIDPNNSTNRTSTRKITNSEAEAMYKSNGR